MQKEQTLYWKNKQLEGQMSSEMQPDESCEDYIKGVKRKITENGQLKNSIN